jgi:hypothetical protein
VIVPNGWILKWPCLNQKISMELFEALEQTCRLHQFSGYGGKYFSPSSGVDQGYSSLQDRYYIILAN